MSEKEACVATKGGDIEFQCVKDNCKAMIAFSVQEIERSKRIRCSSCRNEYSFNEELIAKIQKFENLITAVKNAEDILGGTNVSIDVDGHSVKVPYRLLLTRLNTSLTLRIGNEELSFHFRVEPLKDKEYTTLK